MLYLLPYRPDWDRCAPFMEGGEERWATIAKDKSSDSKVELLLKELAGDGEGLAFFEPKVGNVYI